MSINISSNVPVPTTSGGTGSTTVFTAGSVPFAGATRGAYTEDNANLNYDDANNRLNVAGLNGGGAYNAALGDRAIVAATSNSGANPQVYIVQTGNNGNELMFRTFKTRATTAVGTTIVNNGDILFRHLVYGADGVDFAQAGYSEWIVDAAPGSNDMPGGYRLYVSPDGSETPAQGFYLANTRVITMAGYGAGTATFDANGVISSVSDERLKTKIKKFRSGLAAILKLKPIRFHWKRKSGLDTKHEYVGLSAQNVKSVIPEAVGVNPNGTLTLQDRALMAAMVNAIQDLSAEVNKLKTKLCKS